MAEAFRLDGRTALVTGASRGIGRAVALALGAAGAGVAVHYRTGRDEAASTASGIHETGGRAALFAADLSIETAAAELVRQVSADLGPIDILVNNAGIWNAMRIDQLEEERLEEMLNLNLKSVFRLCAAVSAAMRERGWGRIIGISSTAGLLGEPGHSHYAASKGALELLTRSLAVELGPSGITVNTVAPGWTLTEMTQAELTTERVQAIERSIPTRRLAAVEDVAHAVRFLASDEARHLNGVCLPVEGGYRWRR
jgi:3-oxoacyl-[acyl-carrier protein] reductase